MQYKFLFSLRRQLVTNLRTHEKLVSYYKFNIMVMRRRAKLTHLYKDDPGLCLCKASLSPEKSQTDLDLPTQVCLYCIMLLRTFDLQGINCRAMLCKESREKGVINGSCTLCLSTKF